ncbi:helix-turn-helix domain-containing protein [Aeromicrobium chenweiae]|uniref:Transcriptional regulator n=1 Tax=Aeromicrobium chenweiae TaxID=2079793 RepID=A0A2S0WM09_9ACTN|nr:helix-turn-helix transcriptional regulator [Aeromicrobium chenweiae]AWB92310.1 transcriptional regulator [Aeromicrobium chenweiae]TGN31403.1 XRE family transcriptional regulator [Aeromicrobium chenweiae]
MVTSTALGDYLRARRAQVSPETAGIATHGIRRVPGLRREEVAMTAGMSVDYYIRLEQGREHSPSAQVLNAISGVLQLDDDARLHLYRLAGLAPMSSTSSELEQVDPALVQLLEMWSHTPAIVLGRAYDVLAGNPLAYRLFDDFPQGPNLLATMFLDPGARRFYVDWEDVAAYTVASLRLQQGRMPDDPRIAQVVDELAVSQDFVEMWGRHDARGARLQSKRFHHPEVGDLTVQINAFDVRSTPGQELVVYNAEPGSPSAEALARLVSLTDPSAERAPTAGPR